MQDTSRRQNKKFFDPTIFQKCWRGSGRVALIAVRRQRNPRAILLAHGVGGEKSDRFSRRSEQDRRLVRPYQQTSILQLFRGNSCNENALQKILLLEKTVFSVRQKGVLPLLLPASVLQLPRCLVRICNLFHKGKQTANWQVSKSAIAAGKPEIAKFRLLRKCGLLAHTSAAFLKNCCTEKLLVACGSFFETMLLEKPIAYGSAKNFQKINPS